MEKEIKLTVIYDKMDEVVLVNRNGDTYTSKSEDLMDFLHDAGSGECDDFEKLRLVFEQVLDQHISCIHEDYKNALREKAGLI